ncbi:histidine kinase [Ruminococcus sp. CLA-AA-H200]|uniref:Histidine kinase n=1 Tax=Ruminococcus turbiniformis TaxID=2881258 RepID=A0ABS8FUV8_9FIRM|nr:histidine kinase [Ruminococcus turbiniformis]MCC2253757.1 histidine kinase [Ruminococcus turbiniformis]
MRRKWKFRKLSIKMQVMLGIMSVLMVSSMILLAIFYGNLKGFYAERVRSIQRNSMETLVNDLEGIIKQCETVSDQILGLVVFQEELEGYSEKSAYEKLQITRNITSQLTNIKISNSLVDNIYLLNFDGNGFSTNSNWNREVFSEALPEPLDVDQLGETIVLPPAPALYGYTSSSSTPVMIRFLTYLNRFTESKAVGAVQIDVNYYKIEEAVKKAVTGDGDFTFIVDDDGMLIYAPEKEQAGKLAESVSYEGFDLGELTDRENLSEENGYTLRTEQISGSSWRVVQMNSDIALHQEMKKAAGTWLAGILAYIVCAVSVSAGIARGLTRPITNIISSMKDVGNGNFGISLSRPDSRELADLVDSFQRMVREVEHLMKANIQKEHEKTAMQMQALNAQINSHFLYNTLNTIKWQAIRNGNTEIARSIVALSEILEYSCKDTDGQVPLAEEFRFIDDYALLQNMRYNKNVRIEYNTDEASGQCRVLKMLLQPLVENAFMHAFEGREKNGSKTGTDGGTDDTDSLIRISCGVREDMLNISVRDNGKGFTFRGMDQLNGIGLNNILQRMKLNYGESCHMEIHSENGIGTEVLVMIPAVYEEGEDK